MARKKPPIANVVSQVAEAQLAAGSVLDTRSEVILVAEKPQNSDINKQVEAVAERAAEPEATPRADTSFDTASFDKPRLACVADDKRNGIRIEYETSRQPGQVSPRIFIRFADDKRPNAEEKKLLMAEGFTYNLQEKAWAAPKTAVTTLLAKRCANEITKLRDPEGLQLYI